MLLKTKKQKGVFTLWCSDVGKARVQFRGWGNALCRWQKQTLVPVHALAAGILSFVSLIGLASFHLTARLLLIFPTNKWGFCSCPPFMQPLQVIFVPELRTRLLKHHWHETQPGWCVWSRPLSRVCYSNPLAFVPERKTQLANVMWGSRALSEELYQSLHHKYMGTINLLAVILCRHGQSWEVGVLSNISC